MHFAHRRMWLIEGLKETRQRTVNTLTWISVRSGRNGGVTLHYRHTLAVPISATVFTREPPLSVPRRLKSGTTPATGVDVTRLPGHLKYRTSCGTSVVPTQGRFLLLAVHRPRLSTQHKPSAIEVVHRHNQQQRIIHHFPESTEVRRLEEFRSQHGQLSQPSGLLPECEDLIVVPP